jgi:hypothetical protein
MKKAAFLMDGIFKVVVTANLVFINYCFFQAYDQLKGKLDFMKSEMALELEQRLTEEFEFVTKDMASLKDSLLESQKDLIPGPANVKTGLPIFK